MQEVTNKYGMTFKVGQLVEITKQFSEINKNIESKNEYTSCKFIGYEKSCKKT